MATLAELELELGRQRRAASRESRRARRLPATKPPKLSQERQQQLCRQLATGEPVRELAEAFGIGRATAYRYLSQQSHSACIRGLEVVNHPREDARFELLDALSKHAAEHADALHASEAPRLGVTKRVVDRRSVAGLVA
jgi:hypothetical protein